MRDLQACIRILVAEGRLAKVKSKAALEYELAGTAKKMEGKEALLFERPKGFDVPVLTGLMWSRENLGVISGKSARQLPFYIAESMAAWKS